MSDPLDDLPIPRPEPSVPSVHEALIQLRAANAHLAQVFNLLSRSKRSHRGLSILTADLCRINTSIQMLSVALGNAQTALDPTRR